jgi:D-alanine-D-alanine ligase
MVLFNQPVLDSDHSDAVAEREILSTVAAVEAALIEAGFVVGKLGVSHDPSVLLRGVRQFRPDVVFNLFEGTGDDSNNEAFAAGMLQWMKIPHTGCPAHALSVARNKSLTKHLLRSTGLPTADFFVAEDANVRECPLDWPVIVKPALQDASIGLDQGSVVCNMEQLEQRVATMLDRYGPPVLVEEFIRGREFNVAVVEVPDLVVLPVSEILFIENKPGYWPIVTYDAKWHPESEDYQATPPLYPAKVSPRLGRRLADIAAKAFRLTGCRDFARIDFRVKPSGRPYILEVNPNPDFSPDAGLCGALQSEGITHERFTVQMVLNALARASRTADFDLGESPLLQPVS